jgi:hypothetical protein
MDSVKKFQKIIMVRKMKQFPSLKHDIYDDHTKIMLLMYVNYGFKTFRLVIFIFMISYFVGVIIYIWSHIFRDMYSENQDYSSYIDEFGLEDISVTEAIIVNTYFAFTSLSTVGFGDYHPISNIERLFTAFMLMCGVACFSFVMGNFIEILGKYSEISSTFDDGDNLSKFFGALTNFN